MMGIEPTTPSLPRKYSTPELHRLDNLEFRVVSHQHPLTENNRLFLKRAGDGARTRHL